MEEKNLHRVKFLDYKVISGVTYYSISVTTLTNSESWIFESRYRNMLDLHNQISSNLDIKLPTFPPKKWPGNMNPDFISQRQKSLENYFNNLLKVINLENTPVLKQFLYQTYKPKKDEKPANTFKDDKKQEKSAQKPLSEEKKEDVSQKEISHISMKPNFEKIIEGCKFVDLNSTLVSPEEDEVKEKKEKYKMTIFNLKIKFPKKFALPDAKTVKAIDEINRISLPVKDLAFMQNVNACMKELIDELTSVEHLMIKSQLIHSFEG